MVTDTLFDYAAAQAAKQEGMRTVEDHADDEWKVRALRAVWSVAIHNDTFIVDALWEILEKPREARALGPIMRAAAKKGWIARTDRVRNTSQVKSHGAPVTIWQSLIYQPRIENITTELL